MRAALRQKLRSNSLSSSSNGTTRKRDVSYGGDRRSDDYQILKPF